MSTPKSNIFQSRLKEAREMRGLSQGDLAEKAGLQQTAVSHFETGMRKPSFDNLRRLADALEVSSDYLLGRSTQHESAQHADAFFRDVSKLSNEDRDFLRKVINSMKPEEDQDKKR